MMTKDVFIRLLEERQFGTVRNILDVMNTVDIASLLSELEDRERVIVCHLMENDDWEENLPDKNHHPGNGQDGKLPDDASGKTYFETSVWAHARSRIPWLLVLMFTATVSGTILAKYEEAFAVMPVLVAFVPMLMDTGGNCGAQSSTLIIREMALGEIRFRDVIRVMFKELRISFVVGAALCVANGLRIYIMYGDAMLTMVICISLFATVVLAKLTGCALPVLAKRLRMDPAIMASPLITTLVDTCSILVYFQVATRLLL